MKQVIFLLALAAANTGVTQRVVEPMLPRLATQFAVGVPEAAWVITSFGLAGTLAQYFHGPFGDRYGKLRIVTCLTALSAVASLGCAFADHLPGMMAWRFASGLFGSGAMTLGMAYLADVVPAERRQPVLARFLAGSISGQALGPFIGGLLTDVFGWRSTFVLLSAVFAAVAAILFVRTRAIWNEGPRSTGAWLSPAQYLRIACSARVRRILMFVFLEMFFFFGAFSFLGAMLRERFGLPFTLIGLVMAGFGLGGLIYSMGVRFLLRHLGQRGCVVLGGTLGGLLFSCAVFTPIWPPTILCAIGLGFAFYTVHNTLQTKAAEMAPGARATGISLFSMFWSGGQASGVLLMGLGLSRFGYAPMIVCFGTGFALVGITLRYQLARMD